MGTLFPEVVLTDGDLVRQHLKGDKSAFPLLYVRHMPRLVQFVGRRVSDVQTAEDLAQDAFARAFSSLEQLRDPSRFYPWLATIARHMINRHFNRRRESPRAVKYDTVDVAESPDLQVIRMLDLADVRNALSRISDRHQRVIDLREHLELPYAEIAERLGIPESAVAPLLYRARVSLRQQYFSVAKVAESDRQRTRVGPPLIGGALARILRARDRAALLQIYLPEVGTLCGSVACIALTIGLFGSGVFDLPNPPASVVEKAQQFKGHGLSTQPDMTISSTLSQSLPESQGRNPALSATSVVGVAQVGTSSSRPTYGQDYARENMPYYYEFGDFWFGADPDAMRRDLTGTLDGETGWMGDADPNRRDS